MKKILLILVLMGLPALLWSQGIPFIRYYIGRNVPYETFIGKEAGQ